MLDLFRETVTHEHSAYFLSTTRLYCTSLLYCFQLRYLRFVFNGIDAKMGTTSKGVQLIVIEFVILAIDYLVVGLRLWSRRIKRKPFEINDYLIVVGLVWIPLCMAFEDRC